MESKNASSENRRIVLLDMSLFVLDMLSPEKIKDRYEKKDGTVLEVPSAFITMIVDAQAGNKLLRQFIDAYLVAIKNNPIHRYSQDIQIQSLVTAKNEDLEKIKSSIHNVILSEFAPLIKSITKIDQIKGQDGETSPQLLPIQVYEPVIPTSQDELRNLRLAYWSELKLLPHPLFDLYFLQIFHAQSGVFSNSFDAQRELLSVGLSTFKTIRYWRHRLFGKHSFEKYEVIGDTESKNFKVRDQSLDFLQKFALGYFRKKWETIVEDAASFSVELALTFARTGAVGFQDVGIVAVTLYGTKLIAKGVYEKDAFYIFLGMMLIIFVCLATASRVSGYLVKIFPLPTSIKVLPTIVLTINPPQFTATITETQDVTLVMTSNAQTSSALTPTIITTQIFNSSDPGYCMYVVQPNDTLQSISSRFGVNTDAIRYSNNQSAVSSIVVNQLVRINSSCCNPINGEGFPYTVRYKDDIYSISKMFSVSESSIVYTNNLFNPNYIQTGQMLCIPEN